MRPEVIVDSLDGLVARAADRFAAVAGGAIEAHENIPRASMAPLAAAANRSVARFTSPSSESTMTSGRIPHSYGGSATATRSPPGAGLRGWYVVLRFHRRCARMLVRRRSSGPGRCA